MSGRTRGHRPGGRRPPSKESGPVRAIPAFTGQPAGSYGPARTTGTARAARFGTGQPRIDVRAVAPDAAAAYPAALAADLRAPAGR